MKKSTLLFIACLVFFTVENISAQIKQFEVTTGGSDDYGSSIIQTRDGGYAVTGITSSYGAGNADVYVSKLDSNSNLQWSKTIGGKNDDYGFSIVQTTDGGYAITGLTRSFADTLHTDIYVIKLDPAGNLQWTKTIGGMKDDYSNSIIQTKDNGYAIAGRTYSFGDTINGDAYILKLDSLGNIQWTETIGGKKTDFGVSIIQTDDDNGYAITGYTSSFGDTISGGLYIIKLDSIGAIQWTKTIGGGKSIGAQGYSIIQTSDGGFAVTGINGFHSMGHYAGVSSIYIVKITSLGNLQWTKIIQDTINSAGFSIVQSMDKGFVIGGYTNAYGGVAGGTSYIAKLDSSGNLVWGRVVLQYNIGYCLIKTKDEGFAMTGVGAYVLKLDSTGNSCTPSYPSGILSNGGIITSIDSGTITSTNQGNISSGGIVGSGGALTNLCSTLSAGNLLDTDKINPFPNPSNGIFTLTTEGISPGPIINIYNVLGQIVYKSVLNSNNTQLNLTNEPKGIYFYRLQSPEGRLLGEGKLIIE